MRRVEQIRIRLESELGLQNPIWKSAYAAFVAEWLRHEGRADDALVEAIKNDSGYIDMPQVYSDSDRVKAEPALLKVLKKVADVEGQMLGSQQYEDDHLPAAIAFAAQAHFLTSQGQALGR